MVVINSHTLLHWKISPSSNSSVSTPRGSSWIDLPENLDWRLLSPQNFHPLPSQWHAIRVGWWLTYMNTHSFSNYFYNYLITYSSTIFHPIYSPSQRRTESLSLENRLHKFPPTGDWMVCNACLRTKHTPKPQMLQHWESSVDYFPAHNTSFQILISFPCIARYVRSLYLLVKAHLLSLLVCLI